MQQVAGLPGCIAQVVSVRRSCNPPPAHHRRGADHLRVGLFTDTFDEINGVSRFIRDMGTLGRANGRRLMVHTCSAQMRPDLRFDFRHNFSPALSRGMPFYSELPLSLPPLREVLNWSQGQQFDAVHVSTPGPMGLCGLLVAKMLRVPLLITHHTDFPAYLDKLSGSALLGQGTAKFLRWFYAQADAVFLRSSAYRDKLTALVDAQKVRALPAGINRSIFRRVETPRSEKRRLLYVGRISVEKNLQLLVDIFRQICARRNDVELHVVGDGPFRREMQRQLRHYPVTFSGYQGDEHLPGHYSSADLLVFPSITDTLGQVVMEAQACGLPAIVSSIGGPKETVIHEQTGLVADTLDAAGWINAIETLLNEESRRSKMSQAATHAAGRFSIEACFEHFWHTHAHAVLARRQRAEPEMEASLSVSPQTI